MTTNEEVRCYCGIPANEWISRTPRNYLRPFFACSKYYQDNHCGYFQWLDELSEYEGKVQSACVDCRSLKRTRNVACYEKTCWEMEKMEMIKQIDALTAERDAMKKKIKLEDEIDLVCKSTDPGNEMNHKEVKIVVKEKLLQIILNNLSETDYIEANEGGVKLIVQMERKVKKEPI